MSARWSRIMLILLVAPYTATAVMFVLWWLAIRQHRPTGGLAVLATGCSAVSTTGRYLRTTVSAAAGMR